MQVVQIITNKFKTMVKLNLKQKTQHGDSFETTTKNHPIKFQLLCNANNEILILIVFVVFTPQKKRKKRNSKCGGH